MARRIENECAFCAEAILEGEQVVGKDWKVYCSKTCAEAGEKISAEEWSKVMETVVRRDEDKETRGQGDKEKGGQGDLEIPLSPTLLVSVSHSPFFYVEFNAS